MFCRKLIWTAFAAALMFLGPGAFPARASDAVSLRLDWKLTGYHVPFYWAKEKGYFAQEGLDVEIKEGSGSGPTINLVGGKQDDIGLADLMLTAVAATKGMPVKAIYGIVQDGAWAIVSHADHPIKTPQELVGKTIASTADHKALLDLFLQVNHIPADKVSVQVTSAATRNTVFTQEKVDGFVSIVIGSPMDLVVRANQGKDKPVYFMPFEKFGLAPLGQGLLANNDFIARKPEVLKRFLRAAGRAFTETANPAVLDEATAIAIKASGSTEERYESVKLQWADTIRHFHTENTTGKPIGWMSPKDWGISLDILHKTGELTKDVAASSLFTDDFIAGP